LARCRFGYSATAIAERLGYRGPSSVSHSVRRIEKAPDKLRKIADKLEAKLG
jgi:chromosomal replication initiation ATPase DnaA